MSRLGDLAADPVVLVRERAGRGVPGVANTRARADTSVSAASFRDQAVWWHSNTRFDTVGRAAIDALARPDWIGHAVFITG